MSVELLVRSGVAHGLERPADDPSARALVKAAAEFEALFLLQMLKQMRQSMLEGQSDGEGFGAATMFDTIDSELARHLAGNAGLTPALAKAFAAASGGEAPAPAVVALPAPAPAAPAHVPTAVSPAAPVGVPKASPSGPPAGLDGPVTSAYGWRKDPLNGARRFHAGVDLKAAYGAEVPAAAEGKVLFAGERGGYGLLVEVEHPNGMRTRYAHLSATTVRPGDEVGKGESLGQAGRTGRATGVHVHLEVLEQGRRIEPLAGLARLEAATRLKLEGGPVDYPIGKAQPRALVTGEEHED